MQTVAETPTFTRQAEKLFDEDEKAELISFLADNPLSGDVIPDTAECVKSDLQLLGEANVAARGWSTIFSITRSRFTRCWSIRRTKRSI